MKKLLIFLFLLSGLGLLKQGAMAQVPVGGTLGTLGPLDKYPTHLDEFQRGGYRTVATIADRDLVTNRRRKLGMLVFVLDDGTGVLPNPGKMYILKGNPPPEDDSNPDNTGWEEYTSGSNIVGTQDFIPRFATTNSLGNSTLHDNGSVVYTTAANGFVANGDFGAGDIPASEDGTRMMWYPGKGAFRAGVIDNDQWNDEYIGSYSIAMGKNVKATGDNSMAIGDNTLASNYASTAMGYSTIASGSTSTAIGFSSIASGNSSTAMGNNTIASGNSSTAMGNRTNSTAFASLAIGQFNKGLSFAGAATNGIGWNVNDPIFEVGIGVDVNNKSNAFTIFKGGRVTIGTLTSNTTIAGTLQIQGGTPGAGKVLTSDANGLASWDLVPLSNGMVLIGNISNKGMARTISGDLTISSGGVAAITNDAVTTAKIQDGNVILSKLPSMPKGLLGSPGISGSSPIKQIRIGDGLSLSTVGSITTLSVGGDTDSSGGTLTIGDEYGGGIIVYVTPNGKHGLIVAKQNQTPVTQVTWYAANNEANGEANHDNIGENYTDWRLPTKAESALIFAAKQLGFVPFQVNASVFWCSSEVDNTNAYIVHLNNNTFASALDTQPKDNNAHVRAIRSF